MPMFNAMTTKVGLLAAVAAASVACADEVEIPTAPDLSALNAIYESPPGMLDFTKLEETAQAARMRIDDQVGERLVDLVSTVLVKLRDRLKGSGYSTEPDEPSTTKQNIKAVAKIDNTCRGWDRLSTTPDAAANGHIDLTAVIDHSALQRTIWGTAYACRGRVDVGGVTGVERLPDVAVYLDGPITIELLGPLPKDIEEAKFLVQTTGTHGDEEQTTTGELDFRVVYPQIETRVPVQGGDAIASVGLDGISLRGSNGTFKCDIVGLNCVRM